MTKHVNKAYIQFIGNASSDVTGSAYRVKFGSSDVLLECGMIQDGRDIYSLYQANKRFMDKQENTSLLRDGLFNKAKDNEQPVIEETIEEDKEGDLFGSDDYTDEEFPF